MLTTHDSALKAVPAQVLPGPKQLLRVCYLVASTFLYTARRESLLQPSPSLHLTHDAILPMLEAKTDGSTSSWRSARGACASSRPQVELKSTLTLEPYPVYATTTTTSANHEFLTEDPALTEHYSPNLSRVLLTSDLGTSRKQYNLRFSCVIPGKKPLAMFTTAKKTSKLGWFNGPNQDRCLPKYRWWRCDGLPRMRPSCTVKYTVSNRWQYKICRSAIRFNGTERQQLCLTTGGGWSKWGDWDLWPATVTEVAHTCRLQGHSFGKLLGKRPGSGKRYKLRRCLRNVSQALKRVFSK
jgi:hypothetical protein